MSSKTEISNMAISHLGIGKEIANLETEQSQEASACRRFYEACVDAVLADLDWTFATKEAVLNLVVTNPNTEWLYSYTYPTDCVNLRRIKSGIRRDTQKSRVPYKILKGIGSGKLIYTDKQGAEVEYTVRLSDPTIFSPEFSLALSFNLAAYIAPRLTGGDPFKMKQEMLNQYRLELGRAKKKNMNEEVTETPPPSEFITTRSS